MKRLLAIVPIVAIGVCSSALVASAGLDAPVPLPTTGYTVIIDQAGGAGADPSTDVGSGTNGLGELPDLGVLQGTCEGRLAAVDLTNGTITPLSAPASVEACVGDLTFAPDGTLYGILRGIDAAAGDVFTELARFDTATGAPDVIGRIGDFSSYGGYSNPPLGGISFDAQGRLFVLLPTLAALPDNDPRCLDSESGAALAYCLYRIDDPSQPGTVAFVGRTAEIPPTGPTELYSTLAADCTGPMYTGELVGLAGGSDLVGNLRTVDTTTGAPAQVGGLQADHFIAGQAFDRAGTQWALTLIVAPTLDTAYDLATIDPSASPVDSTRVANLDVPSIGEGPGLLNGLAIAPLDCTPPAPIVLEPTFTG